MQCNSQCPTHTTSLLRSRSPSLPPPHPKLLLPLPPGDLLGRQPATRPLCPRTSQLSSKDPGGASPATVKFSRRLPNLKRASVRRRGGKKEERLILSQLCVQRSLKVSESSALPSLRRKKKRNVRRASTRDRTADFPLTKRVQLPLCKERGTESLGQQAFLALAQ